MGKVSTSTGFLAGFLNHQPSGSGRISPSTVSPPSPKVPAALRSSLLLSRLFFVPTFQGGKNPGKIDGESATFYKQKHWKHDQKNAKHANFDKKQPNKNTYKHLQNSSTNKNVMLQLLLFLNMENSVDFELRLGFEQNSWLSSNQQVLKVAVLLMWSLFQNPEAQRCVG